MTTKNKEIKSDNHKLAVSEYFYSLQGEGRTMGIPAIFLRLTGCNLMCGGAGVEKDGQLRDGATWVCDTIAVWLKGTTFGFAELVEKLNAEINFCERLRQGVHLVITGGEPLLQQKRIVLFLDYLASQHDCRPIIEIETNACYRPLPALDEKVQYWNTSPKLKNSGMAAEKRIVTDALAFFNANPKTMFKFVIRNNDDWTEIQNDWINTGHTAPNKIVLMPAASSIAELLEVNKVVADICIANQIRMCTRLHVEIWNQLTGV